MAKSAVRGAVLALTVSLTDLRITSVNSSSSVKLLSWRKCTGEVHLGEVHGARVLLSSGYRHFNVYKPKTSICYRAMDRLHQNELYEHVSLLTLKKTFGSELFCVAGAGAGAGAPRRTG